MNDSGVKGCIDELYNFKWDLAKAASNLNKHGVSFEEVAEVFVDLKN